MQSFAVESAPMPTCHQMPVAPPLAPSAAAVDRAAQVQGSEAEVSLHGAHIISFKPRGEVRSDLMQEVIFVSKKAIFQPPAAIRGGVPVCWPQFSDMGPLGSHGFARNSMFAVEESSDTRVVLVLHSSESTLAKFDHAFELRVIVELTEDSQLKQTMIVKNCSPAVMRFTNALHTYYRVSDIRQVKVTGLEGCSYHDNLDARALKPGSSEPITFAGETDRIYASTGNELKIVDEGAKRVISIRKEAFADAVVWNPWIEKAKSLADFDDEEYLVTLCIEPANAAVYLHGSMIEVEPSAEWKCAQVISVSKL